MNDELSHIAQWESLRSHAQRFGLRVDYGTEGFCLFQGDRLIAEQLPTLADVRAAISNNVATRRAAGERI